MNLLFIASMEKKWLFVTHPLLCCQLIGGVSDGGVVDFFIIYHYKVDVIIYQKLRPIFGAQTE